MENSSSQVLYLEFDKESSLRFCSFLEEILIYRNPNVKGVIMNFQPDAIVVIYYYFDEKDEGSENFNYL